MSSPTPPLAVEIRPSRLYAAALLALAACVLMAAALSNLGILLKSLLAFAALLLLFKAWRDESTGGLCSLRIDDIVNGHRELTLRFADARLQRAPSAGHAWLGTLAIFIYVHRTGWSRILGPQRYCITRDAVTTDEFRRLRTRLALG